jgi:hemerythrin-like domain-containing protein
VADLNLNSALQARVPSEGRVPPIDTLRKLVELYSSHIWKEYYLLLPMTEKLLNESEQEELSAQFEQHEAEIGIDVHHGFEQFAGRILEMICGEAVICHTA